MSQGGERDRRFFTKIFRGRLLSIGEYAVNVNALSKVWGLVTVNTWSTVPPPLATPRTIPVLFMQISDSATLLFQTAEDKHKRWGPDP